MHCVHMQNLNLFLLFRIFLKLKYGFMYKLFHILKSNQHYSDKYCDKVTGCGSWFCNTPWKFQGNVEIKYLFHLKAYNYYNYRLNIFITSCINAFSLILILKYNLSSFFLSIHHSHMNKVHRFNKCLSNT